MLMPFFGGLTNGHTSRRRIGRQHGLLAPNTSGPAPRQHQPHRQRSEETMALEGPENIPRHTTGPSFISSPPKVSSLVNVFPPMIWPDRTSRRRSVSEVPTQIPMLLEVSTPPTP